MPATKCSAAKFIKIYLEVFEARGTMADVAERAGLQEETCWTKRKRIDKQLEADGRKVLPALRRRRKKLNLQAVGAAIERAEARVESTGD